MKNQSHSYPTFSTASSRIDLNRKTVHKLVCTTLPQILVGVPEWNPDRHCYALIVLLVMIDLNFLWLFGKSPRHVQHQRAYTAHRLEIYSADGN